MDRKKATIIKLLIYKLIFIFNGAPGRSNLEPFDGDQLLLELENWAEILKAEPEVIHRLAVLAEAQDQDAEQAQTHVPEPPEFGL